jgi:hypothetical protein
MKNNWHNAIRRDQVRNQGEPQVSSLILGQLLKAALRPSLQSFFNDAVLTLEVKGNMIINYKWRVDGSGLLKNIIVQFVCRNFGESRRASGYLITGTRLKARYF